MKYFWTIVVIILIAIALFFVFSDSDTTVKRDPDQANGDEQVDTGGATSTPDGDNADGTDDAGPTEVIGRSVEGRDITAYHYGDGEREVLFVGGTHGAYSWNTAQLAYRLMDRLEANPSDIPEGVKVTVVPVLNPDGLNKVVGTAGRFDSSDVPSLAETIPGRFNANGVDLNRNFDCNWKPTGNWQDRTVDTGDRAFSEPESVALRDYVRDNSPDGVVVWYSASGDVIASSCNEAISSETRSLLNTYADASGYPAKDSFDYYTISGDATDWMAKTGIPAISVVLATHDSTEWSRNWKGIQAILNSFAN